MSKVEFQQRMILLLRIIAIIHYSTLKKNDKMKATKYTLECTRLSQIYLR